MEGKTCQVRPAHRSEGGRGRLEGLPCGGRPRPAKGPGPGGVRREGLRGRPRGKVGGVA